MRTLLAVTALAVGLLSATATHAADKIKIGYWTSGVSLGFGAVLEAKDFLAKRGVEAEFVHFPDVNAPLRALATGSVDLAFGAPLAGVLSTSAEGVPIKIFLGTQPADAQFVVPEGSPIKSIAEFKGKKIAMSPAGSSVAVIAGAIMAGNYGIKASEFSLIGGNESRLAQFLAQKQVDGAALRSVTIAQLTDLKVVKLGSFAAEWKKLTQTDSVPYVGVGAVRGEYVAAHPAAVANVVVALRDALAWGDAHRDEAAAILQKQANLPEADAKAYMQSWGDMYRVSFEPADIETMKREHAVFLDSGMIKGALKDDLFVTGPYTQSKSIK